MLVNDRATQAVDVRPSWVRIPLGVRLAALVVIVVFSVAIGGVVGLYRQPPNLQWVMKTLGLKPGGGTDNPIAVPLNAVDQAVREGQAPLSTARSDRVVGLGKLEPLSEVMTVAPPSGVRDARVAQLLVREGGEVAADDLIAILDNERRLQAVLDAAKATVALREAGVAQARNQSAASLGEARANLARAEAAERNARFEFERTQTLYRKKIAAKAAYDQKRAALDQASREVDQVRATLSRYQSAKPDDQADVVVALRQLDTARAEVRRAAEDLEQAYVRAPISGTILAVHVRPGEKLGEAGVVDLAKLDEMAARVEVYETEARRVTVGDPVVVSSRALPEELTGTVRRIGLEVKSQSVIEADPGANTDARVIEVIVALDDASSKAAARYTNLQVNARIGVRGQP